MPDHAPGWREILDPQAEVDHLAAARTQQPPPARCTKRPTELAGACIITWPQPRGGALLGWNVAILDHATGEPITTVTSIDVHLHADPEAIVWADLEMFADAEGHPIYDGMPVILDREIVTRRFSYRVAEMRVAPCPHPGIPVDGGQCANCGEWREPRVCPECAMSRHIEFKVPGGGMPQKGTPLEVWLVCACGNQEFARVITPPGGDGA